VHEEQVLKHLELTDSVVGGAGSLLTLKTRDTDSDMRGSNHGHVISTVTNSQGRLARHLILDHLHNISLLLRRDSAAKHDLHSLKCAKVHEIRLQISRRLDNRQLESIDNNRALISRALLQSISLINIRSQLQCRLALQHEPILALGQQLTTLANVDRSLDLVPCQDPHIDACPLDITNRGTHIFLQFVFNS
jgi:hypothetical protein